MAIKVKDVEVRPEEVDEDFIINFEELTEEGQKRLFRENNEKFIVDAIQSKYFSILQLVEESMQQCSSKTLNSVILYWLEKYKRKKVNEDMVLKILMLPNLKLSEKNRRGLATSMSLKWRLWVAKNEETSLDVLKLRQMFYWGTCYFALDGYPKLFDAIVVNPNFRVDEYIEEEISLFKPDEQKRIRSRIEELKN